MTAWQTTGTRIPYENPWLRVREDDVVRPDGTPGTYGLVELAHPAVWVVPLTEADEVVLVSVDRYTVGPSVEVPSGGTDGQDPVVAAQRELLEETGYTARELVEVGSLNSLNGVCRAPGTVLLATGLTASEATGHAEEGITEVRLVPFAEVMTMIARREITDGESAAALLCAAVHLGRVH